MAFKMKPTFHLAPRFTIQPPPDGPLHLGTIVDNLTDVEAINETCRLPLLGKEYLHKTAGFVATRSELTAGKFGIWAKFVGINGIGGEFSVTTEHSAEDTYCFERLDEVSFTATKEYITQSMNQPAVKEFVEGGGWEPVYMVTGLKIARGPAVSTKKGAKMEVNMDLGLNQPGGIQGLEAGPKIEHTKERSESVKFEKSDDFIYGIRVKRLCFKRGLFSGNPGAVVGKHFHHGATLVDNDLVATAKGLDEVEADDEIADDDEEMEEMDRVEDGDETWIVLQI